MTQKHKTLSTPKMISVTVKNMAWTHRHSEIITGEFTTVAELKREVHRVCRAMYDMQLIVHDGKLIHDEEAHPSRYCVGQGSLIYLYKKVQVHKNVLLNFEYRGSTYPMTVESQHLIRRLKDRIDTQIGLPPHRQELMYMGALMRDGDLVCDYVIGEAPTEDIKIIELPRDELRTFEIEVHNMDTGECEMMTVDPMDTVNTVCAEMRRRGLHGGKDFCIAYKNQMCSWGTLESNGIRETGIILQMRCSSIF